MADESERSHHSHHHHHHHHEEDEATKFKNKNLEAKKRRKILSNLLFVVLCALAAIITLGVLYVYSVN